MFRSVLRYCGEDSIVCASWATLELKLGEAERAQHLLERAVELDRHNMQVGRVWVEGCG